MSNRTDHPIVEPDELNHLHRSLTDLQESGTMNMSVSYTHLTLPTTD